MKNDVIYHYEKETGEQVIVLRDDSKLDDPSSMGFTGNIVGFDGDDFGLTAESKEIIRAILKRDDVISMPLFYTPKGIYTKSQLEDRLSGCIYVTNQEIKDLHNVDVITNEVVDEIIMDMLATVELYDQYISNNIYQYKLINSDNTIIDVVGGFYDLEQCIDEAKNQFKIYYEDKSGYNIT